MMAFHRVYAAASAAIVLTLLSTANVKADPPPPDCWFTVHNCHSSMDINYVRTWNDWGEFNTAFIADDHGKIKPGNNGRLRCKSPSGCITQMFYDQKVTDGALYQEILDTPLGPDKHKCNANLAFGRKDNLGDFAMYRTCSD